MTAGRSRSQWICPAVAIALVVLLLASVARLYHPPYGFTEMIGFAGDRTGELPVLQAIPHYRHPAWRQLRRTVLRAARARAAAARSRDRPGPRSASPYRARRILFSWTAWALGLGRPQWILQAYALQNVLFWLALAAVMTRWLRPDTPRGLALWIACLFSHGLLWRRSASRCSMARACCSSRSPSPPPSADDCSRSAAIIGVAGLGRETNLLTVVALPRPVRVARRG